MDVDPGYKYKEKFRGGVQWYMMESKAFISSNCFELKRNKIEIYYHSTVNQYHLDYLSIKINSFQLTKTSK